MGVCGGGGVDDCSPGVTVTRVVATFVFLPLLLHVRCLPLLVSPPPLFFLLHVLPTTPFLLLPPTTHYHHRFRHERMRRGRSHWIRVLQRQQRSVRASLSLSLLHCEHCSPSTAFTTACTGTDQHPPPIGDCMNMLKHRTPANPGLFKCFL